MELALTQYALNLLQKEGFTVHITPDLARNTILDGIGFNPRGKETQIYSVEDTDLCLIATAEITLGGLLKDKTREIAKELNLNVADKQDSQDICFVPNGDYASVIKKFKPESYKKGNIKNLDGKVVGVHDGIVNFTIGQRKGIKVSNEEPFYVIKIDAEKNEIFIGPKEKLAKTEINLKNLNLLADN